MTLSAGSLKASSIVRHLPDPILVLEIGGTVISASQPAADVLGRSIEELAGARLADLARPSYGSPGLEAFWKCAETGELTGDADAPHRLDLVRPSGPSVRVSARLSVAEEGPERLVILSVRAVEPFVSYDVTAEVSRCLGVGGRLADQITNADSIEKAYALLLPTLCSALSWEVASLWTPDQEGHLSCMTTWPSQPGPHEGFEEACRSAGLSPADYVAEALTARRALEARLGDHASPSERELAAASSGLSSAVALPLVGGGPAHGVIEFLSSREELLHPRLHEALESLGQQIGFLLDEVLARSQAREGERLSGFLLEAATSLVGTTDYAEALSRLAAVSVPEVADLCLIDVREPSGLVKRMAAIHADPAKAPLVEELNRHYAPLPGGLHPSNAAMGSGRSSWSSTMPDEYLRATTRDERHFELVKALGFESFMCVPLRAGEEILGSITLVSAGSGRRFGENDLALPQELARRAANIVLAARRYEQQHRLTRELQRLLLPEQLPHFDSVETCVRYVPAAADSAAGGDFYDLVRLPSDRLGIAIGDIEGHDTMAAATMGQLRSAIRALSGQVRQPGQLVDALRWSWELLGFERMATALLARLEPRSGELVMASAGHLPPVLVDAAGEARLVEIDCASPLGSPGASAIDLQMVLAEGETLFLYTDGLVEDRSTPLDGRLDLLVRRLASLKDRAVEEICDEVLASFTAIDQPPDDVAVLAVRRLSASS